VLHHLHELPIASSVLIICHTISIQGAAVTGCAAPLSRAAHPSCLLLICYVCQYMEQLSLGVLHHFHEPHIPAAFYLSVMCVSIWSSCHWVCCTTFTSRTSQLPFTYLLCVSVYGAAFTGCAAPPAQAAKCQHTSSLFIKLLHLLVYEE